MAFGPYRSRALAQQKKPALPMQFDSSQKIVLEREVLHWAVNSQKAQLVPQPYAHGGGLVTFAEYWRTRTEFLDQSQSQWEWYEYSYLDWNLKNCASRVS